MGVVECVHFRGSSTAHVLEGEPFITNNQEAEIDCMNNEDALSNRMIISLW